MMMKTQHLYTGAASTGTASAALARPAAGFPAVFLAASLAALLVASLAGCAGPDRPVRAVQYDFGPGAVAAQPAAGEAPAPQRAAPLPTLQLAEIDAGATFDGTAVLYRLAYADANQLRPYAQARWVAPPAQLVRQRLRETLGRKRVVLNPGESAALARGDGPAPRVLRLELEEFSQLFDAPARSIGVVRLRATLLESTPAGEKLLAQRSIVAQRPAATADAPGGVRALAAATDAAVQEIEQWLQQTP